jgi:Uncharacterized protein conserved in bacteria
MRVLVHLCCGPCGIMPVTRLLDEGLDVAGIFYNPNIHPLMEYLRRRESAVAAAGKLSIELMLPDAHDAGAWNLERWLAAVHDAAEVPAGPGSTDRCDFCYRDRLLVAAREAKRNGFDAFTTSLLYSRMQRHEAIKAQAEQVAEQVGVAFLYRDFRGDWQEGIDRSKAWDLFRQNYCGCVYSEAERFARKYGKLQRT